jgi:hypothetical protein
MRGIWLNGGQRFEDEHLRFVIDIEGTMENRALMLRLKETFKARFRQIDIWVVSYEIDVL